MFTGIVSDVGRICSIDLGERGAALSISSRYDPATVDLGASISCAGVCLTVVDLDDAATGCRFNVDVSRETLGLTTLGTYRAGDPINLERALRAGDELGGHMVLGHVDGTATVVAREPDGDSIRFTFSAPGDLAPMIASKGSVALDGTSLTVNEVDGSRFGVNIIPHTAAVTTWGNTQAGDRVNLEVDVFARYLARLIESRNIQP